jgi:hypothetical protein
LKGLASAAGQVGKAVVLFCTGTLMMVLSYAGLCGVWYVLFFMHRCAGCDKSTLMMVLSYSALCRVSLVR